ncbi:hypothetical protein BOTBODRAFT_183270 [Botryobasidium botryosum FD-172 SS1]|uniref:Small ribosomal subunit protein bS18m n=1 Tax=Botryobasidium botryosum (strain FD-172 SS1) TaxID=930990 RepID=A0A067N9N4_BOTB1|nr:hypothetical protein BOTBODRAFT_183270 [Botryobasidium botryosum FD-172 SS1]
MTSRDPGHHAHPSHPTLFPVTLLRHIWAAYPGPQEPTGNIAQVSRYRLGEAERPGSATRGDETGGHSPQTPATAHHVLPQAQPARQRRAPRRPTARRAYARPSAFDISGDAVVPSATPLADFDGIADTLESGGSAPRGSAAARAGGAPPEGTQYRNLPLNTFYAPSDLQKSRRVFEKRRRSQPRLGPPAAEARDQDVFRQLGIDPLREASNRALLENFITEMGKIKGRRHTGLTWWSQRKVGKAVRRARSMGIIPIFSQYLPEKQ